MKLKLSQKLIAALISIYLAANLLLMMFNLTQLENLGYEKASLEAVDASKEFTSSFQTIIDQQSGSLLTLSNMIKEMQGTGKVTREELIAMVETYMHTNDQVFYVNVAFEPNAFDNR